MVCRVGIDGPYVPGRRGVHLGTLARAMLDKILGLLTDDADCGSEVVVPLGEIQVHRVVDRAPTHIHLRSSAETLRRPVGIQEHPI